MLTRFPKAVPEFPVRNVGKAAGYHVNALGFDFDWGDDQGGIGGISQGERRMFVTNAREFTAPDPGAISCASSTTLLEISVKSGHNRDFARIVARESYKYTLFYESLAYFPPAACNIALLSSRQEAAVLI